MDIFAISFGLVVRGKTIAWKISHFLKNGEFSLFLLDVDACNVWNTDRKPPFLVKMRGLPSSHDKWFMRYRNSNNQPFLPTWLANLAIFYEEPVHMMTITSKKLTILIKMKGVTNLYHQLFVWKPWPEKSAIFWKMVDLAISVGYRHLWYIKHW